MQFDIDAMCKVMGHGSLVNTDSKIESQELQSFLIATAPMWYVVQDVCTH